MVNTWSLGAAALGVDALVGDPRRWPHPVTLMGVAIGAYDRRVNRDSLGPGRLKICGMVLALGIPLMAGAATWALVWVAGRVWAPLEWMTAIWMISTTVAWKGLADAGLDVYHALSRGLPDARCAVGQIVGRDTAQLPETEVVRAAVETLAENIVDGIVAPMLYAVVGGAPLAMAYRAVNTLDSMVGYRNARYRNFGWASARLDDGMNFIPARLAAALLWVVMAVLGLAPRRAWRIMRRDARRHPSPNAGIPEAMMAGGLGVRLGGLNYYGGVPSRRAELGDATRALEAEDIVRAVRVVRWTGVMMGLVLLGLGAWRWLVR
ncbi:adenosylcobinamide-phosphate synthase CbiB [Sulfobacillus harzensis]|uniref:Cobalamin biosynthesis protein CobD n=1 Tax=Sulfobacillus harzensis TaxID=2729629 RepID=A0A7Y0L5V8_9FIRM|nr:adenosylcobinamide-phosphate synthase CbiB [Sulfobacillus harzensis]NMP23888.1 cobalamin biosynthesis protein CobD [Sulfobacillus harzensis]